MVRRGAIVALALVLLVSLALAVCQFPLRPWCSLASLRRIDDYPLYVMHYYGDYGFDRFVESGVRPASSRASGRDPSPEWACSGFASMASTGAAVFGRNFDWHNRQALLLFTDPSDGYASVSMVDTTYLGFPADVASWSDRRRLLGAPYMPFDGMNERGLAVGMMAVSHARDTPDPHRVTIGSLHAIRLMLDYAADTKEAISLLQDYTIDFGDGPPIHYFVADRGGRSAVIEYIDGKMAVSWNTRPWQVSTNFLIALEQPQGSRSSCWRYSRADERLARTEGTLTQVEAMDLLQDVSQPNTMWSIVYNMTRGDISVVVGRKYGQVYEFRHKTAQR